MYAVSFIQPHTWGRRIRSCLTAFLVPVLVTLGALGCGSEDEEGERTILPGPDTVAIALERSRTALREALLTEDIDALTRAANAIEVARQTDSTSIDVEVQLARVRYHQQRYEEAVMILREMTEEDPHNPDIWGLLGDAYLATGKYRDAEQCFARMNEMDGGFHSLVRLAGLAFEQQGYEKAIEYLDRAIRDAESSTPEPGDVADAYARLSEVFYLHGYWETAEDYADKALAELPNLVRALGVKAEIERLDGNLELSKQHYDEIRRLTAHPRYRARSVRVLLDLGEHAAADSLLDDVHRQYEELFIRFPEQFAYDYASFLLEWNIDIEEAFNIAYRNSRKRRDIYAYELLAWAYYRTNQMDLAWSSISLALRKHAQHPRLFYLAAVIAKAAGMPDKFEKFSKRSRELNPRAEEMYGTF